MIKKSYTRTMYGPTADKNEEEVEKIYDSISVLK